MKNAKHVMQAAVGGILFCSAVVAIIGIVPIPSSGNATVSAKPEPAITFTYIGETYSGVVIDNLGVAVQEVAFYPLESRVAILVSILVSDQQKSAIAVHAFSLVDEAGNVYSATEDDSVNDLLNPRDTTMVPVTFMVPADLAKQKLKLQYQGVDLPLAVRKVATLTTAPAPPKPVATPKASPDEAATPAIQQDLPADFNQPASPGDALLKSLPKPTDYVNDFAHVLSSGAVANLDRVCGRLDSKSKVQVAVVTINSLNGADIADFSKNLFNTWGIGHKGSDRGVLVLLAVNDHKSPNHNRIWFGKHLDQCEGGRDRPNEAVHLLHASDFDRGMTSIVTRVAQVIADEQ